MDVTGAITLAIALLGAVLGIINTWITVSQARPKMRVRLLAVYSAPKIEKVGFSIEVTNLSNFPLTIREVGFSLSPWWKRDIERLLLSPFIVRGDSIPCRLEPRHQANFYFNDNLQGSSPKRITGAYAKTDCGVNFTGVTPALKEISKQMSGK
jgi:hypothetical protein